MLLIMSDIVSPFGIWLKEARERQGLSMRDLAARTGGACTYGVIGQLETGRGGKRGPFRPSVDIVDALAKALGTNVDEAREKAGYAPTTSAGFLFRLDENTKWDELTEAQQEAVKEITLSAIRSLAEVSKEVTHTKHGGTIRVKPEAEIRGKKNKAG